MKKYEQQIREFAEDVQIIFQLKNWTWTNVGVPTVKMIEDSLHEKVEEISGVKRYKKISSGRLFAEKQEDELGELMVFGLDYKKEIRID